MLQAFEKLTIDIDCEKLKADGKDKKEFHQREDVKMRCEMTQHPSQETHSRKKDDERAHRQHHSHRTKDADKRSKSPDRVGCFQRPKLPDEIKAQSAVRDDLGKVQRI